MRNILLAFLLSWVICDTFGQVQYLGSPTTTVRNRGNFVSDSLFYLPKRQKAPSDTGAIRYAISDSSVYVWTGYQWNKLSPGSFVAIGDTASMLSPYTRGSGTTNYLPIFNSSRSLINSKIYSSSTSYYLDDTTSGGAGVNFFVRNTKAGGSYNYASLQLRSNNDTVSASIFTDGIGVQVPNRGMSIGTISNHDLEFRTNDTRRIRLTKDGEFFVNGTTDQGAYNVQVYGGIYAGSNSSNVSLLIEPGKSIRSTGSVYFDVGATSGDLYIRTGSGLSSTFTAFGSGRVGINTTTDLGYNAQVIGTLYNSSSAVFAAGSGAVGIGTTSAVEKLEVSGNVQINGTTFFKYANGGGYFGSGTVVSGNAKETALRADSSLIFSAGGATEAARFNIQREFLIGGGSDAGAYVLQVAGAIYNTTTLTTGAPTSGTAKPWRLGEAATVSPTSPNRTIRVEIDGTVYYLHAKTTND
jgi:hypothetical protein